MADEVDNGVPDEGDEASIALVPASAATADRYEAKYMRGQGTVLYRAKERASKAMQIAMLSVAGSMFIPALFLGVAGLLSFGLSAAFGLLTWALFAVLRVTVSEGAVDVQYGLFGPTIPTDKILAVEPIEYDWKRVGGWGIRRVGKRETIYNMPGDQGRAVRVVWSDDRERRTVTIIGSTEPERLAASIRAAMARTVTPPALPPAD